jgi:hypothetical protein
MLPDDEINRSERLKDYATEFLFAQRVMDIGVAAIERYAATKSGTFDDRTRMIVCGLLVRAVRQYRALIALAEWGLVDNMEVFARSLFENLLAVRFIVNEPKPLSRCSLELRGCRARLPRIPKTVSAVDFRATLYESYWIINTNKRAQRSAMTHGFKRSVPKRSKRKLAMHASSAEITIGRDWLKAQKESAGYSGLSIALLAEQCGVGPVHTAAYGLLCLKSHANNALDYFDDRGGKIAILVGGCEQKLQVMMHMAADFFLLLIADVNRACSLGLPVTYRRGRVTLGEDHERDE